MTKISARASAHAAFFVVQPIGLVLHELAVNAARHGSLVERQGQVRVEWKKSPAGFELAWIEESARSATVRHRHGFGSMLISALIEKQLNGHLERNWKETGLDLRMTVPLN